MEFDSPLAKAYLDACLAEYKMVRDEASAALAEFFRLIQFGSTTTLGLAGVGATLWKTEAPFIQLLLAVIIPTLAFINIELLTGQVARVRRAARFCREFETKLHHIIGDPFSLSGRIGIHKPLSWQAWLEGDSIEHDQHYTWIYTFGIGVFFLFSWASILVFCTYAVVHALYDRGRPVVLLGLVIIELL